MLLLLLLLLLLFTIKCACLHALQTIPQLLAPHQLGSGIAGGVEAAVHARRVYLQHLHSDKAVVTVDFRNAFNTIRRDVLLRAIDEHIPNLLPFVHSAYGSPSILMWEDAQILSAEGIHQGDPLGPMPLCLGTHKLVSSLSSEFNVFYLDDGTIGGNFGDLLDDIQTIKDRGQALGLSLNVDKLELISHNKSEVSTLLSAIPHMHLQFVRPTMLLCWFPTRR